MQFFPRNGGSTFLKKAVLCKCDVLVLRHYVIVNDAGRQVSQVYHRVIEKKGFSKAYYIYIFVSVLTSDDEQWQQKRIGVAHN